MAKIYLHIGSSFKVGNKQLHIENGDYILNKWTDIVFVKANSLLETKLSRKFVNTIDFSYLTKKELTGGNVKFSFNIKFIRRKITSYLAHPVN